VKVRRALCCLAPALQILAPGALFCPAFNSIPGWGWAQPFPALLGVARPRGSNGLFFFCARLWLHVLSRDSRLLEDVAEKEHEPAEDGSPSEAAFIRLGRYLLLDSGDRWRIRHNPRGRDCSDLALAGALVRGLKLHQGEGWAGVLFHRSMIPFLILLFLNLIAVQAAHVSCPGNDRLSEMVHNCKPSSQ
jgi:hypothetical protein